MQDEDFDDGDYDSDEGRVEEEEGAMNEPDLNIIDMSSASFEMHSDSVYCAAFHPSEPGLMVSGGGDDRAFLWRYNAQSPSCSDQPATEATAPLEEAPASLRGSGIVWAKELGGHSDTVTAVGFNFDGTLVLTGAYDGVVNVWSASSGELVVRLEGPEDVEWATWHGKGNAVLAGSKDGTIWMWLAPTGQCVQVRTA